MLMTKKNKNVDPMPDSAEFRQFLQWLSDYTVTSCELDDLSVSLNLAVNEAVEKCRGTYALLQERAAACEARLEVVARAHPEWFGTKKSIKTPYGTVKLHAGTKLEVKNEEVTVLLISQEADRQARELNDAASDGEGAPVPKFAFDAFSLIRIRQELDLEALEKLDDLTLRRLGIRRVTTDHFSVTPAKIDLAKAVREASAAAEAHSIP